MARVGHSNDDPMATWKRMRIPVFGVLNLSVGFVATLELSSGPMTLAWLQEGKHESIVYYGKWRRIN